MIASDQDHWSIHTDAVRPHDLQYRSSRLDELMRHLRAHSVPCEPWEVAKSWREGTVSGAFVIGPALVIGDHHRWLNIRVLHSGDQTPIWGYTHASRWHLHTVNEAEAYTARLASWWQSGKGRDRLSW